MSDYNLVVIDVSLEYKNIEKHSKSDCTGLDGLNFFHEEINWAAMNHTLIETRCHEAVEEINKKNHKIIT